MSHSNPNSNRIFVSKLSGNLDTKYIKEVLWNIELECQSIYIPFDGTAFITFFNVPDAEKALSYLMGMEIHNGKHNGLCVQKAHANSNWKPRSEWD